MRIAIFHDFFGSIGGGEKLVLEIAKDLKAGVITAEADEKNLAKINEGGVNVINIGDCGRIPILKHILASWRFYRARFSGYDFYIMSGCWSIFAAKRHKPNLLYCHTPVRMFYDSYEDFYRLAPLWGKWMFALWTRIHSYFLEKNLKHVGAVIANSRNCQKRVKKYYKRESKIVYPPIKKYKHIKYGDFWLSVNRLYPHKRIELQFEVFKRLPKERLVMVGGIARGDHAGSYLRRMMKVIPNNVNLVGEVDEKELEMLYGSCKGFITTSKDEDFGMNVLEAMSAGKAVVAVDEGGYKESVLDGKTGYRVDADVEEIVKAVKKVSENPGKYRKYSERQAGRFSAERFLKGIKKEIS